jgi:hypothetical protein
MKNIETIVKNISAEKWLIKNIANMHYYTVNDNFINDAISYIKAINDGRMICNIESVSRSGMSRKIKFMSCEKYKNRGGFSYRQYLGLFKALDFKEYQRTGTFTINGCGMNMVFHTNYTIIHRLQRLGFISKKECERLCQLTPTII